MSPSPRPASPRARAAHLAKARFYSLLRRRAIRNSSLTLSERVDLLGIVRHALRNSTRQSLEGAVERLGKKESPEANRSQVVNWFKLDYSIDARRYHAFSQVVHEAIPELRAMKIPMLTIVERLLHVVN